MSITVPKAFALLISLATMVSLLSLDPPMFPSLADRDASIQLSIPESERADQQAQVLDSILEYALDNDTNSGSGILFEDKICIKRWHCPWDSTVVDYIAPVFRLILEKNYLSSSMQPLEDTKKNRSLWWMQRKSLDQRLGKFLRFILLVWDA
ncbi:unnamed protein product [Camellia sinensis]